MITAKEAADLVKKSEKLGFVVGVKDFDKDHYVVEALPNDHEIPEGINTTYGVDKNTGKVTAFYLIPGQTLEKYLSAKVVNF